MIGTIYKLTSPSGKYYIGQTINKTRRKQYFLRGIKDYSGTRMKNALAKYDAKTWTYEILIEIYHIDRTELRNQLDVLETAYITIYDSYNNGYNMTVGGSGSKGCFQTEESKLILRSKALGRVSAFKGHKHSDAAKKRFSELAKLKTGVLNSFHGKQHSIETKQAIGKANSKAVIQMDLQGNIIKEFSSAKEAGMFYGKPNANSEIIKCCKGYVSPQGKQYKTALGYKWCYKQSSTTSRKAYTTS